LCAWRAQVVRYNDGTRSQKYICWTRKQMRYMLGDHGFSYVTGFGKKFPMHVHDRGASCPAPPANCTQVRCMPAQSQCTGPLRQSKVFAFLLLKSAFAILVAEGDVLCSMQVTALYNPAPNPHVLEGALVQVRLISALSMHLRVLTKRPLHVLFHYYALWTLPLEQPAHPPFTSRCAIMHNLFNPKRQLRPGHTGDSNL
jgi:hypothetical protein